MKKEKVIKKKMFEIVTTDLNKGKEIIEQVKLDWEMGYIVDYAYIKHNKDVYNRLDVIEGKQIGDKKSDHFHIGFKTKNANPFQTIANRYGVKENFVESIKSGRFNDYLLYLTHRNAPEKYQYSDDEVNTSILDWKTIRDMKESKNKAIQDIEMFDYLLEKACDGIITREDIGGKLPKSLYVKKKMAFDGAFKLAQEEKAKEININGINKKIVFVSGGSGTGKTTYCKKLAVKKGYSFYVSGSNNDLLDDYKGEDCIILDDVRGEHFELSNLLKLIDNNSASEYVSRYHNKLVTAKMILITSIQTLDEFMENIVSKNKEDMKQVRRRITSIVKIDKKKFNQFNYDKENDCYKYFDSWENEMLKELMENVNIGENERLKV